MFTFVSSCYCCQGNMTTTSVAFECENGRVRYIDVPHHSSCACNVCHIYSLCSGQHLFYSSARNTAVMTRRNHTCDRIRNLSYCKNVTFRYSDITHFRFFSLYHCVAYSNTFFQAILSPWEFTESCICGINKSYIRKYFI
jgi:hypothetical protein